MGGTAPAAKRGGVMEGIGLRRWLSWLVELSREWEVELMDVVDGEEGRR